MILFFRLRITFFALLLLPTLTSADQKLELAVPFTDHMILQRGSMVPVWGFGVPGSQVEVTFGDQTKTATANRDGDWMVKLDPLEASRDERSLQVRSDKGESLNLSGVLVGEVWFSSGQSNMVWTANQSMCRDLAAELARSETDIPIREISIDTVSALYPQKRATSESGWKKAKDAGGFSALSLSFAHELYQELDVPIGILLSAHSNTRIEAFTQRQAFESHPRLQDDADLMHNADPLTQQGREAFASYYTDLADWQEKAGPIALAGGKVPTRPSLPGIAGMWRGPSQFFNGKINPVVPYAIRGAIWCQGTSNAGDGRVYASRMEALVRGWRDAWDMPEMPFYFTQMQCYGGVDSDAIGFADIRQVQHQFFMNNREHVGMVVQSDLNSARPSGIHYFNKLHPGMRMARWALAKQYGQDIAYTGPIYSGSKIEDGKAVISFEKESLFGGLMVGSKGMAKDYKEEDQYTEPARPTPGEKLNHFRLCGADHQWHPAEAEIVGDTVVAQSKAVPNPVGVQYAYNAVPENSNLYNRAGLPATPFAVIDDKFIFEEDDLEKAAALKAKYAQYTDPDYPILQVVEFYRDGAIIQRDQPIPIWGHANQGVEVEVTLGEVTLKTTANDLQQWSVSFPPRKASTEPITLTVNTSHDHSKVVKDILVGDVWFLTGSTLLTSDWPYNRRDPDAEKPEAMPLVREFRRRTSASSFTTPRKRKFETGGGKYRTYWSPADFSKEETGVTSFAYHFAKTLNREGVPQGFMTMSSGRGGRSRQLASPLSWTSFQGVAKVDAPAFQPRIEELFLQFPQTEIARQATAAHIEEVKAFVDGITSSSAFPLQAPAFPEAGKKEAVKADTIPTYAYNWNVCPHTPMGVAGVIWIPSEANIGENPAEYAAEMQIMAQSLPATYGMEKVPFYYAQPSSTLVEGISTPQIPNAQSLPMTEWPKEPNGLEKIATEFAELAK